MKLDEMFRRISEAYDLPSGIERDEEGLYHIVMDDEIVAFREFADEEKVISWTEIAPLPADGRLALCRSMLEKSFVGGENDGAFFALQGETIVLMRVDSLVEAEAKDLMERAHSLATCAKNWTKEFAEVNNEAE